MKSGLVDDGITKQDIELHKLDILAHLRQLMQNGDLEKVSKEYMPESEDTTEVPARRPHPPSVLTIDDDVSEIIASERSTVGSDDVRSEGLKIAMQCIESFSLLVAAN